MNKPKHIKFLELFKDKGIGQYVNIADFIIANFTYEKKLDINNPINPGSPYMFLKDLILRELVVSETEENNWAFSFKDGVFMPFLRDENSDGVVYFSITSKGLDYIESYDSIKAQTDLNMSFRGVNNASIDNYRRQIIIGLVTVALAFTSVVISVLNYIKNDATAQSVDQLRLEIRQWRKLKSKTLIQASLLPDSTHKPLPSVLNK